MVLNKYRGFSERVLTPVARVLSGVHPNTISAVSLIFAFLAGFAFVFADKSSYEDIFKPGHRIYIMLAIASICIFLNGFLDAIDGRVARLTNRISKRGDLFDHALDRYADILILGGIMLSPYCDPVLGALAIIGVLMTSYMGTQAQALGCGRDYGGILGRADRLVILIIVPLLQMWVNYYLPSGRLPLPGVFKMTVLEYTMLWFFIAGNITAIHRGIQSWRELRTMEEGGNSRKPTAKPTRSTIHNTPNPSSKVTHQEFDVEWEDRKPKTKLAKKGKRATKVKSKMKLSSKSKLKSKSMSSSNRKIKEKARPGRRSGRKKKGAKKV